MRRSRRHPTLPLFPEDDDGEEMESPTWLADPSPSVQAVVEQKELSSQIYGLLNELPEIYRSVITLIDIYNFDYLEAAKALDIPVGTVKSRLARARLQMAEKLQQNYAYQENVSVKRESSLAEV